LSAFAIHLLQTFFNSFAHSLFFTAFMVFQIEVIGLDALQLVLVGTVMEASIFIFEIPTGIVADVYSRRLSVIIGVMLQALAFGGLALLPSFAGALLTQALWGLGYTFTSGAYQAWLVDEVGQAASGKAFLRGGQVGRAGGILGIGTAALLAGFGPTVPIIGASLMLLGVAGLLVLRMPENGFRPTPAEDRTTWQRWADTFRGGLRVIRSRPTLMSILAVGLFFGLYSEGWDRLWQAHLIRNIGLPDIMPAITWFSLLSIGGVILDMLLIETLQRRMDMNDGRKLSRLFFALTLLMVISIIGYGLSSDLLTAIVLMYVFSVARSLVDPVLHTWTNQHIDSPVRATVLSLQSQTDAIGQIVGGPPIGAIGTNSLRLAFFTSGLILSPALILLRLANRRAQREPVVETPII
jgi:DHA3 family tetracycline resistance protein-like MFS transporter